MFAVSYDLHDQLWDNPLATADAAGKSDPYTI